MTLTPEQIESADPDAWTGKPTSIVYENIDVVEAWLDQRGYTDYAEEADPAIREKNLIAVTSDIEATMEQRIWGSRFCNDQGLIFPGTYVDRQGDITTIPPKNYLNGIALAFNKKCINGWGYEASLPSGAKRLWTKDGGIERSDGMISDVSIMTAHPEIWTYLSAAISSP